MHYNVMNRPTCKGLSRPKVLPEILLKYYSFACVLVLAPPKQLWQSSCWQGCVFELVGVPAGDQHQTNRNISSLKTLSHIASPD